MPSVPSDDHYKAPEAAIPPARRVLGKEWLVTFDGAEHRVVLNHSKWGMTTKVYVDDLLMYKSGDLTTALFAADIPVRLGDHELFLSIRDTTFSSLYSLSVDGVLVDGPEPSVLPIDDKEKREMQGALAILFVIAPLLYFVGGDRWRIGPIRTDHLAACLAILGISIFVPRFIRRRRMAS